MTTKFTSPGCDAVYSEIELPYQFFPRQSEDTFEFLILLANGIQTVQ